MSAPPRDLLKTRAQRIHEVYESVQLQAGQANSQLVSFGCVLSPDVTHAYNFAVSAGEYVLGQSIVAYPGAVAQAVPGGAALSAGQNVLVLVEADAAAALHLTVGAITTGVPALPSPTAAYIVLGYLSLSGSFTPGTTTMSGANTVSLPYSAGNVSPLGGY